MKNIFKVSLLAAAVLAVVGCNEQKVEAEPKQPVVEAEVKQPEAVAAEVKQPEAVAAEVKQPETVAAEFKDEDAKAAYAIGASVSRYIQKTLNEQSQLGVTLDKEMIIQGISDALREEMKLNEEEVVATLQAYDKKLSAIAKEKADTAAAEAKEKSAAYLTENGGKEGVTTTDSGLQYKILTQGEGPKPVAEDTVTVHYEGRLVDGTVFDSSYTRGQPASFPLNRVIPGWTEGVQLMDVGSKYQFTIPSELAYGEQGAGNIPPFSTLVFDVELVEIEGKGKPAEAANTEATTEEVSTEAQG